MREILFRGQTRRYGEKVNVAGEKLPSEWVYGGIFPGAGDFSVIYDLEKTEWKYIVYSDTVGQYTGLTDKNGKKIFEGDIVQAYFRNNHSKQMFQVVFDDGMFLFDNDCVKVPKYDIYAMEVIGNIHDNPELLGGADND